MDKNSALVLIILICVVAAISLSCSQGFTSCRVEGIKAGLSSVDIQGICNF